MDCCIHNNTSNETEIIKFTEKTCSTALECATRWHQLPNSHPNHSISKQFVTLHGANVSSTRQLYYHKGCYQRLTNKSYINRLEGKRKLQKPQVC